MYKRDYLIYIKDMLENMEKAEEFIRDLNYESFTSDEKTHYAVVRCIEIIGEAAKHIPDQMRKKYPEIPWKDMAGMRDKVTHFYFGINLEKVWLAVKKDIFELKPLVKKVLKELKGFTFVELIVSCVILVIFWVSFLTAFNNLLKTAEYSQAFSYASTACRNKLEEMLAHDFATLRQDYDPSGSPGGTPFNVNFPAITGITGKGYIKIIDRPEYYGGGAPGEHWVLATDNAGWGERWSHTSLVFPLTGPDSKMWVIGGASGGNLKNDVWYSSDPEGKIWTCATTNAGWSPRRHHTSLVYANKMWVMGGEDSSGQKNDVWWSIDGQTWNLATDNAGWPVRRDHASLVFPLTGTGSRMWVMGGYHFLGGAKNDVWYSTDPDGISWFLATDHDNWPKKYAFTLLVYPEAFPNEMWVMGGRDIASGFENDVWHSTDPDGEIWNIATDNPGWSPRASFTSLAYDKRMWVMGGTSESGLENDVWYSTNGINWTCATTTAEWPARAGYSSVVYKNRMWVICGWDSMGGRSDVWYSAGYDRLLEVIITVSWKTRDGRVFGEQDTNGNGILDPAEDKNDNGAWDSPVQLRTLVSERNIPHIQKVFLGRP